MVSALGSIRNARSEKIGKTTEDIMEDIEGAQRGIDAHARRAAESIYYDTGEYTPNYTDMVHKTAEAFAAYRGVNKEANNFNITKSRTNYQMFREKHGLGDGKAGFGFKVTEADYREANRLIASFVREISAREYAQQAQAWESAWQARQERRQQEEANYQSVINEDEEPVILDAEIIDEPGQNKEENTQEEKAPEGEVIDAEVVEEVKSKELATVGGGPRNQGGGNTPPRNHGERIINNEDPEPQARASLFNQFLAGGGAGGTGGSGGGFGGGVGGGNTPPPGGHGGNRGGSNGGSRGPGGPRGSGGGKSGRRIPRTEDSLGGRAFSAVENATGLDKHGQFRVTWRPRVGPLIFNMGRAGLTSVSLRAGPMRYMLWGRDFHGGFSSMDLPSGLSFRGKRKRR